jgi:CubicO group peptidase (beta-lactamase class C family)
LLLSKIVEKISGKTFDTYTGQNRIFAGLKDTGFNPNKTDFYRIAPT